MVIMTEYITVPVHKIGQHYGDLRIIDPMAEVAMERSMRFYGQMIPVIIYRVNEKHYEMIDGFKRLRVGNKLGFDNFSACIFSGGVHAAKAAMIHLNMKARTISDLEKAMVIRSLHRDDGLSQVEIGALLGRHKSWICRRLALVERLSDEVTDHLKLGLITTTIGRELAKLPYGNQSGALQTTLKYRFNSLETARLVALLLKEPRWNHEAILRFPEPILDDRQPDPPPKSKGPSFFSRLIKLEIWMNTTALIELDHISLTERNRLLSVMERIETIFGGIRKQLGSM